MKTVISFIIFLLISWQIGAIETRGLQNKIKELDDNAKIGKNYLNLNCSRKYKEWILLKHSVKDAKRLKDVLLKKYYIDNNKIFELFDSEAKKENILLLFKKIQLEINPENSLLIFYAELS
ncbi:MAG: hypothetical protein A2086_12520 [Spirochaetes bacterium GWD1_27_9]|nr:MAG: hypothetical protein A2Z98_10935 [Spirochaetes bacterium GWB1_27_13]OHD28186.1 MAG: hypothetical protein A2Y34_07260 [Spirochaetes bacterium GWC1_27_15]OHD44283.1 MAG: hypothetical protein A2086_12520 [Spirochaetes bacterium GWD1_27_9]